MNLPAIQGVIRRRLLLNYRVDPQVIAQQLPSVFTPKLHQGYAIAGICLIRLEHVRPLGLPSVVGLSSENAAHRIAVNWDGPNGIEEGVFIPRRDTNSALNRLAGGRAFPGEYHAADFDVTETDTAVVLRMDARDGTVSVRVSAEDSHDMPRDSCFSSIEDSSSFFEPGALGYSVSSDPGKLHGVVLQTKAWHVDPLAVDEVYSSYFTDAAQFPRGSVEFDHGLIMRNVEHEWHSSADIHLDFDAT